MIKGIFDDSKGRTFVVEGSGGYLWIRPWDELDDLASAGLAIVALALAAVSIVYAILFSVGVSLLAFAVAVAGTVLAAGVDKAGRWYTAAAVGNMGFWLSIIVLILGLSLKLAGMPDAEVMAGKAAMPTLGLIAIPWIAALLAIGLSAHFDVLDSGVGVVSAAVFLPIFLGSFVPSGSTWMLVAPLFVLVGHVVWCYRKDGGLRGQRGA